MVYKVFKDFFLREGAAYIFVYRKPIRIDYINA